MKHPHVKFFKGEDGNWYWHTTSINSNILSASAEGNGYETRAGAVQGFIDSTEAHLRACGILEHQVQKHIADLKANLGAEIYADKGVGYFMSLAKHLE